MAQQTAARVVGTVVQAVCQACDGPRRDLEGVLILPVTFLLMGAVCIGDFLSFRVFDPGRDVA
jgi:hypothetical protein